MKFKLVESIDDRLVEYNSTVTNLPNKCGIYCYIFNVKDDDIEANLKEDSRIPNSGIIMEYYGSFLYAIPSRYNPV